MWRCKDENDCGNYSEKIRQRRYVIIPCNRCKIIFISRILPVKSVWRSRTCKGISETGSGELNSFVYRINHTEEYAGTRAGKRGKIFLFGRGGLTVRVFARICRELM